MACESSDAKAFSERGAAVSSHSFLSSASSNLQDLDDDSVEGRVSLRGERLLMKSLWLILLLQTSAVHAQSASVPPPPPLVDVLPMKTGLTGYTSLFDGKSLSGWDGDSRFWRVENGLIVGEAKMEQNLPFNTFLVWRGGIVRNFQLEFEYRICGQTGNSGIQYRSRELQGSDRVMAGNQADFDVLPIGSKFGNTGGNFDERGRTHLARPGQMTIVGSDGHPRMVASLGDNAEMNQAVKSCDWNRYDVIARDNLMVHIINGRVTSIVLDDDPTRRPVQGELGLQMHHGMNMRVEFRRIMLMQLP
jgi:hypothetical protein